MQSMDSAQLGSYTNNLRGKKLIYHKRAHGKSPNKVHEEENGVGVLSSLPMYGDCEIQHWEVLNLLTSGSYHRPTEPLS